MQELFNHTLRLRADPSRVVVRPFHIAWAQNGSGPSRSERIVQEVLAMSPAEASAQLEIVLKDFEARHWQTRRVFMTRYDEIEEMLKLDGGDIGDEKRQLLGAYFCHEYSYAAAALMNPSAVPHYDQSGMPKGSLRILMSLRAVGEGHISSVSFREGIITDKNELTLAPEPPFATAADAREEEEARIPEGPVTVYRHRDSTLSGTVIFPITKAQSNGLEDLRICHFTHDDGTEEWIGTYTAYNGSVIQSELMRTRDWRAIDLVPMSGGASRNKGMALFPRKIDGKYMMLGRQDGENIFLHTSDDITHWEGGELLIKPQYPWELVQMGNCGPPIEVDEGWLVLTHGVGAMRKYSIGAALLDKNDPSKVLARSKEPLLAAADQDREGYVPNVVYTCGAIRHGRQAVHPLRRGRQLGRLRLRADQIPYRADGLTDLSILPRLAPREGGFVPSPIVRDVLIDRRLGYRRHAGHHPPRDRIGDRDQPEEHQGRQPHRHALEAFAHQCQRRVVGRDRRMAVRPGEHARERHAEQALADDQAGRRQHAHPLGELGIGLRSAQRS
jgi:hypothetical protein